MGDIRVGDHGPHTEGGFDVLILGAGLSGVCSLHHIRERFPSWRIRALEAASGVGGTWFWNRYPGARFDSESVSYGFSWDKGMLEEWHWKEEFSPQPETLKYIERIVERNDLARDIQFNTSVVSARWQEDSRTWRVEDENGGIYVTRFLVTCLGFLSAPTLPNIPGINDFQGQSFHTSRWPKDFDLSCDFAGKNIGVIGTGATGIQTITAISKEPTIKNLLVFQRTANWSAPLRNAEISPEKMADYRKDYDKIFKACAATSLGFIHPTDLRKSADVSPEERIALYQSLYDRPGFTKWLAVFSDMYTNQEANDLYSEWMADRIRERLNDPEIAESLIPTHGFGTKRIPLDSGYFEAYNRDNVHLVDLKKTPIERVTEHGIRTVDGLSHSVDVLVFATGFDAITGAFSAIEWQGKDGRPLISTSNTDTKTEKETETDPKKEPVWPNLLPRTFLGLTAPAMPNLFMCLGPHQPFGNSTRSIESAVNVIVEMLEHCHNSEYTRVEPTEEAVQAWTEHVWEDGTKGLAFGVDSWLTGVNRNVKGKQVRSVARYAGSAVEWRRRCEECRGKEWEGLVFE